VAVILLLDAVLLFSFAAGCAPSWCSLARNQELLQQALASSSDLVATAAADTLLQLWRSICNSTSEAATAPAHAVALRQALQVLQHGSNSAKDSAAEFCWLASASESQSSAALLMPDGARVLAAALTQPAPAPWVVFALAALCNTRERALEERAQPPAVLQAWLNGDAIKDQYFEPLRSATMATEGAEAAEMRAAEAAAAGDEAAAATAQQQAAEYRAEVQQLTVQAEQHEPAVEALWNALPQAAVLLRCVLEALGCFSLHERFAAAAYQALSCALEWGSDALFPHVWERLQEQFDQKSDQPLQQQQHLGRSSVGLPHSVAALLLACAPDLAALPESGRDIPCFNRTMPTAADVGQLWSKLVAGAPKAVQAAVVGRLQEQLCSAFEAANDVSTSEAAGSSRNISKDSSRTVQEGVWGEAACWGCCSVATSRTSNRPSSTSSAARKAASLLQVLSEQPLVLTILRDPRWMKVFELQPNQTTAAADPAAAEALRQLQHALLAKQTRYLAWTQAAEPAVDAAHQQQLQAALAGSSDAYELLERLLSRACSKQQLQQHAASLAAVLQAQPWLQAQQQQQQHEKQHQGLQGDQPCEGTQGDLSCVVACSILCKLVAAKEQTAVAEACRELPAYLQQLLLGAAAVAGGSTSAAAGADGTTAAPAAAQSAPQAAAGDGAAPTAAVSEAVAAATAAFLRRLLLLAADASIAPAQSTVLKHVAATAPALVVAALQQEDAAISPKALFAQLVMSGPKGSYVQLLLKAAVEQQVDVQQLVSVLLQYAIANDGSSTGSRGGINTSSSGSSSGGTAGGNHDAAPGLAAAAADVLWTVLVCSGQQPWIKAVAAVLAEQRQAQQLQQALQQAVNSAAGDYEADAAQVSGLARILRGVCDHEFAAVAAQLTAFLQELIGSALQQGDCKAAQALAILTRSKPVQQQLLQHTSALLQAVQPGKPAAVQAAALHLLEALVGTEEGRTAVGEQDWRCVADIMMQQGSWVSSSDSAATAPLTAGSDGRNVFAPLGWHNEQYSAAEVAACIVVQLVPFDFGPIETEECVRKLLQAAVCPSVPAGPDGSNGSSNSSSAMDPGNSSNSSNSSVLEGEGTAAGGSDSGGSSMHRQWSVRVARVAVDAVSFLIEESDIGFATAAKHVGLLLSAMQNTQHTYIAGRAREFVLNIAQAGGLDHICTPENVDKLLAVLQQPVKDHAASEAAETAAEILGLVVRPDIGFRLLAEQRRYDALVRAMRHQYDRVARIAAELVMIVTCEAIWMPIDRARKGAAAQAGQQQQQGGGDDPAAQQAQQDQLEIIDQQQQEQQQADGADPAAVAAAAAAAAPLSDTAALVPQRWHVQLLAEAAQNPVLAKPAIRACAYIADSCGTFALLLAPYRAALLRAARRLRGLVGVDWEALNHRGALSAEQMVNLTELEQAAVEQLRGFVSFVWHAIKQVHAKVKEVRSEEVWLQQAAAVQFALLWRGSEGQQQGAEQVVGKRVRLHGSDDGADAAAAGVMEVTGEDAAQAAGCGIGGSCGLMEQQQQQQLMAALCTLVVHSKRRTDLQHMLRTSRRHL
jgi:hypothetical protein